MKSINFKFPLKRSLYGFFESNFSVESAIISDFLILLQTSPGERVCMGDFGIGLRQFLFEPQTNDTKVRIKSIIIRQTKKYIPLIQSINPIIYFSSEIVLGNPLYGKVVLDDNSFFLNNQITITNPAQNIQINKNVGLIIS